MNTTTFSEFETQLLALANSANARNQHFAAQLASRLVLQVRDALNAADADDQSRLAALVEATDNEFTVRMGPPQVVPVPPPFFAVDDDEPLT